LFTLWLFSCDNSSVTYVTMRRRPPAAAAALSLAVVGYSGIFLPDDDTSLSSGRRHLPTAFARTFSSPAGMTAVTSAAPAQPADSLVAGPGV
jgi:hypothetical protein